MRTFDYLTGPDASLFLPAVFAGIAIALSCGTLSVFVVLRRLAFIGHGVSHAAFGGVGVAAVLGLVGGAAMTTAQTLGYFTIVGGFCLAAALSIAWLSERRGTAAVREDTIIGMTLVASMALGALLLHQAARTGRAGAGASLEGSLFGAILGVGPIDAAAAWAVAILVATILWTIRRPLVFWAFDENAARAFGIDTLRTRLILMAMLGIAIVAAMKLAGVILATALLVMPGAVALRLSQKIGTVLALSVATALLGVLGGLILSFELDWPTGPSVVAILVAIMAVASVARR